MPNDTSNVPARFWAKLNKNGPDGFHSVTGENLGPCWIWTGSLSPSGYSQFWAPRSYASRPAQAVSAYRYLYQETVGAVPADMELDHLCRVHACCNPAHLEPVTHATNMSRRPEPDLCGERQAAKTHCPAGHPYDAVNTIVRVQKKQFAQRLCRICQNAHVRAWYARRKAAAL
jgi:hypothetical protein